MTPNDEITTSRKPKPKKPAKPNKPKKDAGTAVAVDDPAKRQQVVQAPQDQLLAAIIRASGDPACDPAKMRELIEIKRELDQDAAKAAFDDAFVALQAELPSIRRDRKIEVRKKDSKGDRTGDIQQSTPYATFEAIMAEVKPLLTKHGFSLSFETSPMEAIIVGDSVMERILVKGILSRKGHQRTTTFAVRPDNSGSKNPTQAQGSGQSYGKRYCTIALLNIVSHAPEDADTDGREGNFAHAKGGNMAETTEVETLTPEEIGTLTRKIADCKVPVGQVLTHYKIESIADLPSNLLATAIKQCDDYAANQRRKAEAAKGFPGDQPRGR
jgi:hypothetical protein